MAEEPTKQGWAGMLETATKAPSFAILALIFGAIIWFQHEEDAENLRATAALVDQLIDRCGPLVQQNSSPVPGVLPLSKYGLSARVGE